ncbi:MAG: DUF1761 domain-containing protein [Candidatus Micrarchaeota archaeon]
MAVIVATVFHIVLGLIWFHPKLFGNKWTKLTGKDLKPNSTYLVLGIFGHFIMSLVLAILIKFANSGSGFEGLIIGLIAWIGFIVPLEIGELIWEKIPFKLFILRIGNQFVGMALTGFILGAWQ